MVALYGIGGTDTDKMLHYEADIIYILRDKYGERKHIAENENFGRDRKVLSLQALLENLVCVSASVAIRCAYKISDIIFSEGTPVEHEVVCSTIFQSGHHSQILLLSSLLRYNLPYSLWCQQAADKVCKDCRLSRSRNRNRFYPEVGGAYWMKDTP